MFVNLVGSLLLVFSAVVGLFIVEKAMLRLRTVTETHVLGLGLNRASNLVVQVGFLHAPLLARPVALMRLSLAVQ